MDAVRQYILSISAAAFFCGIIKSLLPKGAGHTLVSILCGTFMAFSFINPLLDIDFTSIADPIWEDINLEADAVVHGTNMQHDGISEIVINKTESYIIEKARQWGASLEAEITLSGDELPVPTSVTISGSIAPYAKKQLQQIIRDELGIPEEEQLWIG